MQPQKRIEARELSTGDLAIFDKDERTLYLIKPHRPRPKDVESRDELKRMAETGDALALGQSTLVSLYEEFTRIAVLV